MSWISWMPMKVHGQKSGKHSSTSQKRQLLSCFTLWDVIFRRSWRNRQDDKVGFQCLGTGLVLPWWRNMLRHVAKTTISLMLLFVFALLEHREGFWPWHSWFVQPRALLEDHSISISASASSSSSSSSPPPPPLSSSSSSPPPPSSSSSSSSPPPPSSSSSSSSYHHHHHHHHRRHSPAESPLFGRYLSWTPRVHHRRDTGVGHEHGTWTMARKGYWNGQNSHAGL